MIVRDATPIPDLFNFDLVWDSPTITESKVESENDTYGRHMFSGCVVRGRDSRDELDGSRHYAPFTRQ